jgi:hypothetical protein
MTNIYIRLVNCESNKLNLVDCESNVLELEEINRLKDKKIKEIKKESFFKSFKYGGLGCVGGFIIGYIAKLFIRYK